MNKLFFSYIRRYGNRDIILIGIYICVIFLIYLYFRHQCRYAEGLGDIRHKAAQWWVVWNSFYAFVTAFTDYQSTNRSYETSLLPVSVSSKFNFTLLRILAVLPVISGAILVIADYAFCHLYALSPYAAHHATSMLATLTYTGSVYHRLPIMPYYLLTFVTIIIVLKTVKRRWIPVMAIPAVIIGFATVYFGPHFEYHQYNYPFLAGKLSATSNGTSVVELVSWTNMGARTLRIISYVFLLAFPASMVYLSYLRFKELEPER